MSDVDDPAYREIFGDQSPPDSGGGSSSYFTPSKLGGAWLLDEPRKEVKVPTPAELGEQWKATGQSFLADTGLMATGLGELYAGPVGRLSAQGTQYLEGVKKRAAEVNPSAGLQSGILTAALPGGFALKTLQGARGLGLVGRAAGIGAGYGAAVPTGKEDLKQRLLEKAAYATGGGILGAGLGTAGALGQRIASDASKV